MTDDSEAAAAPVRTVEHCWIPMPDGVRLSARLWIPEGAETSPVPAIVEYIPYRKRDLVRTRDERNHPVFAAHGYASLRVDMRGSGDSEGVMPDMYAPDEISDARRVIEWIAAQPWCVGRVGMFGTSWGGTASLQAAVEAPAPLKAVLANCATIDRFEDDIHWMGGCVLTDSVEWGATLPAILAAPPDGAVVGSDWRDIWRERLDRLTFPLEAWLRNDRRGDYWRRGSVRFDADNLSCPVLAIGGWSDRYSNSVAPLVAARPDLCWGVVGPWGHHYPDQGAPGPGLDFQSFALSWWDHWLKNDAPAPLSWPRLRLWRREADPPGDRLDRRSGGWTAHDDLEPKTAATLRVGAGRSLTTGGDVVGGFAQAPFDLAHGACAGDTGYFGRSGGLPLDQEPDDARALCFETAPIEASIDLVGAVELSIVATTKRQDAQLVARLCDVGPDGTSSLIVRTVRNLALDDMLDEEASFSPERPRSATLRFPTTSYRLRPGRRLRLALATSYWPLVWPTTRDPELRVDLNAAVLTLPTLAGGVEIDAFAPLESKSDAAAPDGAPSTWRRVVDGALERASAEAVDGTLVSGWRQAPVETRFDAIDVGLRIETSMRYEISLSTPVTARCVVAQTMSIDRPDGRFDVRSEVLRATDGDERRVVWSFEATVDGATVLERDDVFDV